MKIKHWMALSLLAGASAAPLVRAADVLNTTLTFCVNTDSAVRDHITSFDACSGPGHNLKIRYKGDGKDFSAQQTGVSKAIIAVHGVGGSAASVFNPLLADIQASGVEGSVWLIAPQFLTEGDLSGLPDDILQWSDTLTDTGAGTGAGPGYALGNTSILPLEAQVSSFEIMDNIIRKVMAAAKNTKEIIVVGFSAGGRFVNRYSIGTNIDGGKAFPTTQFRYLIASPGSYTYLSGKRYSADETTTPTLVADPGPSCPAYNDYPYGLLNIPATHYMQDAANKLQKSAKKRRLYIVGENDTEPVSFSGDPKYLCAEEIQGPYRRNRAFNYMHHLRSENAADGVGFCVIKDAIHNAKSTVGSDAAMFFWRDGMVDCAYNDGLPGVTARRR